MSRCEIQKNGTGYLLSGSIDETFGLATGALPVVGDAAFNLKGLKSINSTGIREWIKLMQKMKAVKISFLECPKVFIDQVNMVQGFAPDNSKIMSFYVPYFNETNETEKNVLLIHGEHYGDGKIKSLPKVVDDKGVEMELDVVEAKYFKFIKG